MPYTSRISKSTQERNRHRRHGSAGCYFPLEEPADHAGQGALQRSFQLDGSSSECSTEQRDQWHAELPLSNDVGDSCSALKCSFTHALTPGASQGISLSRTSIVFTFLTTACHRQSARAEPERPRSQVWSTGTKHPSRLKWKAHPRL